MAGRRRGKSVADVEASGAEANDAELRVKAWTVHQILCREYGCPIRYFHDMDPLSELVSSLLSHRTRNADSGRAFKALRARFATWEAVRDAPVAEVEETIAPVTWPEQKAPRIQHVLREITRLRGELSLDFLAELPVPEARAWLEALPGVGPKTSAATLLFSRLRMPALPVDSHHHRVATRLALIPESLGVGPSHAVLEAQLPEWFVAQDVYDNHEVLMLHGQRCCHHRAPACYRCVVYDLCPTGQRLHPELASDETPVVAPLERPA
jgi:endonuclease-3